MDNEKFEALVKDIQASTGATYRNARKMAISIENVANYCENFFEVDPLLMDVLTHAVRNAFFAGQEEA